MDRSLFPDLPGVTDVVANPTDTDYATAARYALSVKSLPRAIEQISAALALAPLDAGHLGLLDDILAASRAPLELVKIRDGEAFFGRAAVYARVLAREGSVQEALRVLGEVLAFRPSAAYLPWAQSWAESARTSKRVSPSDVAVLLTRFVDALSRRGDETAEAGVARNFEAAEALGARVGEAHPENTELALARSRIARALGHWTEALDRIERLPPSEDVLSMLGELRLELGEPELAFQAYDRALALAPSVETRAAREYARYLATQDRDATRALDDLVSSHGHSNGALLRFAEDAHAYDDELVEPFDPTVRVIRDALRRSVSLPPDQSLVVRIRVDRVLAPSAVRAFLLGAARLGREGKLLAESMSSSLASSSSEDALWRSEGDGVQPARPRPEAGVLESVRILAKSAFSWSTWLAEAQRMTSAAGAPVEELVSAVVHILPPPDTIHPVEWVHRWQLASALLIAASKVNSAARFQGLELLLQVDHDWASAAAVLGCAGMVELEPEQRPRVVSELVRRVALPGVVSKPNARALAVVGMKLTTGAARTPFSRLRVVTARGA